MNTINYIIKLLNLQDKHLIVSSVKYDDIDKSLNIEAFNDDTIKPKCCPFCGSTHINKHGYTIRKILYLKNSNQNTYILFRQDRYICLDCGKTFNEVCPIASKNNRISQKVKEYILEETRKKISMKDIADNLNISNTTAFNEFKKHVLDYKYQLTEVICIDEFKASTIAGSYALIIGDPISGKILDVLESRKQDYIISYFQTIPKEDRLKVKYVNTDLYEAYKAILNNIFPNAIIIADRFHWISLATEAFNDIRIKMMNYYEKLGNEVYKGVFNKYTEFSWILRTNKKVFLANKYKRNDYFYNQSKKIKSLHKEMTLTEIIEYCCNEDNDFQEAYFLLQDLYKIAKLSNFENARKSILDWCDRVIDSKCKIEQLKPVAYIYRRWINEIVNSFIISPITKERMSNGFIEGKNNFVKTIKRIGFGYKDFDLFRFRILYGDDKERDFE